jgi:hypothetical protein
MLEHFPIPPRSKVFSDEDFRHHTRLVNAEGLTFAERAAAHYTALLQDRTLKRSNTSNGYWFCICVYDALLAAGVSPERITFNTRANKKRNDDIDLLIEPSVPTKAVMCLYLKASLRERWKQVDRDARIAKDHWGKSTQTVCLIYAEKGVQGFCDDLNHQDKVGEHFREMEEWAYGVDSYAALSQTSKVNRLIAYLIEDAQ